MDERKIACIVCVNDARMYEEAALYLRHLLLPPGMALELVPVWNAASMAAGYNAGMARSEAKYKVYLHQDVLVLYKNALAELVRLFCADARIGLVGLAGCRRLPPNGVWWQAEARCGTVHQALEPENLRTFVFGEVEKPYAKAAAVDGFFLATQYDVPWREDLFDDWHFYDISASLEFARRGYEVVVPHCERPWCLHCCGRKALNAAYEKARAVFLQAYGGFLQTAGSAYEKRGLDEGQDGE